MAYKLPHSFYYLNCSLLSTTSSSGDSIQQLKEIFTEAFASSKGEKGSIIVLDEIESICADKKSDLSIEFASQLASITWDQKIFVSSNLVLTVAIDRGNNKCCE